MSITTEYDRSSTAALFPTNISQTPSSPNWGIVDAVSSCWNAVKSTIASFFSSSSAPNTFTEHLHLGGRQWTARCKEFKEDGGIYTEFIPITASPIDYSEILTFESYIVDLPVIEELVKQIQSLQAEHPQHYKYVIHFQSTCDMTYESWFQTVPDPNQKLTFMDLKWLNCHALHTILQRGTDVIVFSYATTDVDTPLTPKWNELLHSVKFMLMHD